MGEWRSVREQGKGPQSIYPTSASLATMQFSRQALVKEPNFDGPTSGTGSASLHTRQARGEPATKREIAEQLLDAHPQYVGKLTSLERLVSYCGGSLARTTEFLATHEDVEASPASPRARSPTGPIHGRRAQDAAPGDGGAQSPVAPIELTDSHYQLPGPLRFKSRHSAVAVLARRTETERGRVPFSPRGVHQPAPAPPAGTTNTRAYDGSRLITAALSWRLQPRPLLQPAVIEPTAVELEPSSADVAPFAAMVSRQTGSGALALGTLEIRRLAQAELAKGLCKMNAAGRNAHRVWPPPPRRGRRTDAEQPVERLLTGANNSTSVLAARMGPLTTRPAASVSRHAAE